MRNFIDCLEGGYTIEQFLEDFPTVSHDQAISFLEDANADAEMASAG